MSLGALNRNNLAYLALAIKQDAGFLSIEINRTTIATALVQYAVKIMKRIDLRQNGGELIADMGIFCGSPLFNNLRYLGVGHTRMRIHNRFVKLVFGDIALAIDLHLADHTESIFPGI